MRHRPSITFTFLPNPNPIQKPHPPARVRIRPQIEAKSQTQSGCQPSQVVLIKGQHKTCRETACPASQAPPVAVDDFVAARRCLLATLVMADGHL